MDACGPAAAEVTLSVNIDFAFATKAVRFEAADVPVEIGVIRLQQRAGN